jgi:hypothetical protein
MLVRVPMSNINLLHIFVQSMLLMYIGYTGSHSSDYAYLALMAITLCIPILVPAPDFTSKDKSTYIQLFHYLILLPSLTYISYMGYYEQSLGDYTYLTMLITGIIVFLYHVSKFLSNLVA